MKKTQGSITSGIIIIILSLILFALGIWFFSLTKGYSGSESPKTIFMEVIIFPLALFVLGTGVYTLIRGIIGFRTRLLGRRDTCTIVELYSTWAGKAGRHYYMEVQYTSDSGCTNTLKLRVSYFTYVDLSVGMVLPCYTLGEECYVKKSEIFND